MIFIGVDGGGTTTRAAVVRFSANEPEVLGSGFAPSSNLYSVGIEAATRHIENAVNDAFFSAHISRDDIRGWGLGLAGACTHDEQKLWRQQLAPLLHNAQIVVDEDVVAAHRGAFASHHIAERAGVICIAGTGANSFGIDSRGNRARADGLGPLLGDRGSGYRIGEAALRAICGAHDGSAPNTALLVRVLDHFAASSVDALVPIVYAPTFTKDKIAEIVPIVLQCAHENDAVAQELLDRAAQELAATCAAVMCKLKTRRVTTHGGLLSENSLVHTAFFKHLRLRLENVERCQQRYDATLGAALLASDAI